MESALIGIPFLDDLRRKWQEGALPAEQALNALTLWEDDAAQRTSPELDAAWTLRGEIEALASGAMSTQSPVAPNTPDATGQPEAPSASAPSLAPAAANIEAQQNPGTQAYNSLPRLRDLNTQVAQARSRRDWGQVAALRTEVEGLITQHNTGGNAPLAMPPDMEATFQGADEAQEAERLVGEAQASRRKGDFSEAAYRLAEAARLDPRYTPLSAAQQQVSDLQRQMRDLRDNSLQSPEELADAHRLARRLAEDDGAPESEYVSKKRAEVEAEINRRVEAAKQYVDADITTVDEPGSLDDKTEALGRLGGEVGKIEILQPDAPYLPDMRSRYIAAKRQIERLKLERDNLLPEIGNLDPKKNFDVARLGNIVQRLEALAAAPFARGDSSIDTAAQNLGHRLNSYLSSRIPTEQTDQPALREYEQVLALAQRGTYPLSAQQIATFSEAVRKVQSGSQPNISVNLPTQGSIRLGSVPPGSVPPGSIPPGSTPRSGSVPPPGQYGESMPVQPVQGSQSYGSISPSQSSVSPYNPTPPQNWTPPQSAPVVAQQNQVASRGVPMWAWLLPLLVVLAVGGYFGWTAYQGAEKEKQAHAQATATAQAQGTAEAIAAVTRTAEANDTATAMAVANATSTAEADASATADANSTETAVAEQAATDQTATAVAQNVTTPNGSIQSVTVDYDALQSKVKGMLIHVKFTVDNVKDIPCQASAYFEYSTGEPVKDTDGEFAATDGQAAVSEKFSPGFDSTIYDDFQIFMPYTQLEVAPGSKYDLRFKIQAYVVSPYKLLATSDFVDFTLTK